MYVSAQPYSNLPSTPVPITGTTAIPWYPQPPVTPNICPGCGRCRHCGHKEEDLYTAPYQPWWGIYPANNTYTTTTITY